MTQAQPTVPGLLTTQFYLTVRAGRFCGQNYLQPAFQCPNVSTIVSSPLDNLNLTGPAIAADQLQVGLPALPCPGFDAWLGARRAGVQRAGTGVSWLGLSA